jgi:hypothetical protein
MQSRRRRRQRRRRRRRLLSLSFSLFSSFECLVVERISHKKKRE